MTYPPPSPQSTQQPYGAQDAPTFSSSDRTIAMLAHLSPIIAGVVSAGSLSWAGPLVLWFIYKDKSPMVRTASASSFNFHITVWLATLVGFIMCVTLVLLPVGIVLITAAWVAQLVLSIVGAVKANNNEVYSYPYQVPLLSN